MEFDVNDIMISKIWSPCSVWENNCECTKKISKQTCETLTKWFWHIRDVCWRWKNDAYVTKYKVEENLEFTNRMIEKNYIFFKDFFLAWLETVWHLHLDEHEKWIYAEQIWGDIYIKWERKRVKNKIIDQTKQQFLQKKNDLD